MKPKPINIFNKLALLDHRKLDALFHTAHDEVFEHFDCLSCGNCCKSIPPVVREADQRRIAKHLRMKPSEFWERYIKYDEDDDTVMNASPCPFLESDNKCKIYDHRPLACAEYPHTNRVRMYQILKLTEQNSKICPAIVQIVEKIKLSLQNTPAT